MSRRASQPTSSEDGAVTVVRGAYLLPMDGRRDCVCDGAVVVRGAQVSEAGEWPAIHRRYPTAQVFGDGCGIVLPGLVNVHTHLSEALIPSLTDRMNLFEWFDHILAHALPHLDREKAHVGGLLKSCEMLRSGVTTVSDMFVHYNPGSEASLGAVDALDEAGLRGLVCFGAEDNFDKGSVELHMAEHWSLFHRTQQAPLVGFRMGIGTLAGQSDGLLRLSIQEARREGWAVHTHLAEAREELTEFRRLHDCSSVEFAARMGLLDLELLAAHCIWLTDQDWVLLKRPNVSVAHNPVANMYLGSGVCQIPRMLGEGITIGLGTDGAASNNNQNMFGAMKAAALLQKIVHLDAAAVDARTIVEMATIGGAWALGLESEIGSLEAGKRADIILLDGYHPGLAPIHDPFQQLVYSATGAEVTDVWVNGRHVLAAGTVRTVDERAIVRLAYQHATDLIHRALALQSRSLILSAFDKEAEAETQP